jgi:hypothetical protein
MDRKKPEAIPGELTPKELEAELDEGLEESFPASDPPAATQPVHPQRRRKKSED